MEFDAISKFVCTERAKNLFLVNAMEFMRKVQYFLASVLVELVYLTCLFTNPCLVNFHNMLPMVLRNPQCSKAKNLGGCRKTYLTWFKEQFLKFALAERPLLLLFDGLKVHVTIELIRAAKESQILLYCLSAHSSHFLQPLDLSVFGLLKSEWKRWPTYSIILLAI